MDLTGKLLIAMPGMGDPRFERSVIFVCAHSEDAAMGLIVNKPAPGLTMQDLLQQLSIETDSDGSDVQIYFGGPVENGRGFVLHSMDYASNTSTLALESGFGMTATLDILQDMAAGRGPDQALIMLGYAGWGPLQLESEIGSNGWLVGDASPDVVFGEMPNAKWSAALQAIGIDPVQLSGAAGHA